MSYPPQGQNPQQPYGQPQPGYGQGQPPYPQQQPFPQGKQQPVKVQSVGKSVTKPAWTIGQICAVVFSCGLLYPFVWLKRRSKTTITRHK